MREPIPELAKAAADIERALDAHLAGNRALAEALLRDTNSPVIREWTESLWGSAKANPDQWRYRRVRKVNGAPPHLPKAARIPCRAPSSAEQALIIAHYGRYCVFCGVPVIRSQVRAEFHRLYPVAVPWGTTNQSQHAAFQALWLQFDHVLPHCRGGDNSLTNVVVTCAGCNYGRMDNTLEELGLEDPRSLKLAQGSWDGLERLFSRSQGS